MKRGLIQKFEHIVWFEPELVSENFFGIFSLEHSLPGFLEKLFGFPRCHPVPFDKDLFDCHASC